MNDVDESFYIPWMHEQLEKEIELATERESQISLRAVGLIVLATLTLTAVGVFHGDADYHAPRRLIVLYVAMSVLSIMVITGFRLFRVEWPATITPDTAGILDSLDRFNEVTFAATYVVHRANKDRLMIFERLALAHTTLVFACVLTSFAYL